MFIIRNISESDIVLDDLRVILGPGKEIDLDKAVARILSEHSQKLKLALQSKPPRIKVVNKDAYEMAGGSPQHPTTNPPPAPAMDKTALEQMEARLASKMASKDKQIESLTAALQELVNKLGQNVQYTNTDEKFNQTTDSPSEEMSVDMQSRIHAKAVERMSKGVKGSSIEQEAKQAKDETLADDLRELRNLGLK